MAEPTHASSIQNADAVKVRSSSSGAAHVIAGFRYQLLQSVSALIALRENEELLLEVSEDFTIVAQDGVTDVQVKNSQAARGPQPFSLQPITVNDQRAAALRFADPRVQAPLHLLLLFLLVQGTFTSKDLREHLAPLLGKNPSQLTPGRITYDLRRLRLHGLTERISKTHRYRITPPPVWGYAASGRKAVERQRRRPVIGMRGSNVSRGAVLGRDVVYIEYTSGNFSQLGLEPILSLVGK